MAETELDMCPLSGGCAPRMFKTVPTVIVLRMICLFGDRPEWFDRALVPMHSTSDN